jgi:hypothetical protein
MSAPDKIWAEMPEIFDHMGFWQEKPRAGLFEYVRLDPNTRIVSVDQLERWYGKMGNWTCQDELRAIIDEVK